MNPYLSGLLLVFLALLQSTAWPRLQIGAVWPDALLLVVMSWALLRRSDEALGWAFVGGLLADLLSGGPLGASAIGLMVVALIAGVTAGGVFRDRTVLPVVAAFVGTLAFHGVYVLAIMFTGRRVAALDAVFRLALPSAMINAVLSLFVYRVMAAIDRRISPKPLRW